MTANLSAQFYESAVTWTDHLRSVPPQKRLKALKCMRKILSNICETYETNPSISNKFQNLNYIKICKKFGYYVETCLELLFLSGFKLIEQQPSSSSTSTAVLEQRLIFDTNDASNFAKLQYISKQLHDKAMDSNIYDEYIDEVSSDIEKMHIKKIEYLLNMGFERKQAIQALKASNYNQTNAIELLLNPQLLKNAIIQQNENQNRNTTFRHFPPAQCMIYSAFK